MENFIPVFITIEGIDGSGKTSVVNHLKETFRNYDILFTREPYSQDIREAIERSGDNKKRQFLLFLLDHFDHLENVIEPALKEHRAVISDRYIDSRLAYQSVLLNTPIENIERYHCGSIYPDLTILLYGDVPTFVRRAARRKGTINLFDDIATQKAIQDNFIKLAKRDKHRFVILDANLPLEVVCENAEAVVFNCLYYANNNK